MYNAKIIADSIASNGVRITSMEVTYPWIIHNEIMTHRKFSRNSASSRAIPVKRLIANVKENPFVPVFREANKGMQPGEIITDGKHLITRWEDFVDESIKFTQFMLDNNVAKEIANRPLNMIMWNTILITATDWNNFVNLRCNPLAQREMRLTAEAMEEALNSSKPEEAETHLPYISAEDRYDYTLPDLLKLSTARCARLSYLTHDGVRDVSKDLELHDNNLLPNKHMSAFEHCAIAYNHDNTYPYASRVDYKHALDNMLFKKDDIDITPNRLGGFNITLKDTSLPYFGNFKGWIQYRKTIEGEDGE